VVRGETVVGIISHTDIGWGLMMRYGGARQMSWAEN